MPLPNFLILGAAKSGTTALYRYLKQHPDVFMSDQKEPRFFAFEGQTLDFRGPGDNERRNKLTITDIDSYRRLFDGVTTQKAIGEASTSYLALPEQAAPRIRHYVPQAKLIAILRHPVERAYSGYMMNVREGRETLSFADALKAEPQRVADRWAWGRYQQVGMYHQQLSVYFDLFPREQIRIYLYDDFRADPTGLLRDLFAFLDVDPDFTPDLAMEHNISGMPRNKALHWLLVGKHPLRRAVRKLKPIVPQKMMDGLERLTAGNLRKQSMPPDIRRRLLDLYRPEILKLQDLINRDLSAWLQ